VGGSSETSSSLPASDGSIASSSSFFTSHWLLLVPMPPMVNQHNKLPSAVTAEFQNHNSNSMNDEDHNDEDSFCS
jgi:hypothetical protein